MLIRILVITNLIISSSAFAADKANEAKSFSLDIRAWHTNRTLTDWNVLYSILNTSPGQYSHLRGGKIEEENVGPEIELMAGYHPGLNLTISAGWGYLTGETNGSFVENSIPYSMSWKTRCYFFPVNVEYKIPFISGEKFWIKLFGGGTFYFLSAEIESADCREDILNLNMKGNTFSYQYGSLFEYSISKKISIFFVATTWRGRINELTANGRTLKVADFRVRSVGNLVLSLKGVSQKAGIRYYF